MTREELIAALEKATGPSEELDEAIATWCYEHGAIAGVNYDPVLWLMRNEGFTHSIDAALTLVPEGRQAVVYTAGGADVWPATAGMHLHDMTYAATPAIALCIAALKAQGDGA